MSKEHQARYLRFKADESAQAITGPYRQLNPEDNNERQNIHEHVSVSLPIFTTRVGTNAFVRPPAHVAKGVSLVQPERRSAGVRGSAGAGAQN
jgi:hypothetical protein